MRLRTYYMWAIIIPLAVFAVVAAAGGDVAPSTVGFGPGARVRWIFPRAATRDLVIGTSVCLWLLWTLHRRPPVEFQEALWRAPGLMVVLDALLPLVVVLTSGLLREMVTEQGGRIVLRLLTRAVVGYGYVGLVQWVRQQLTLRERLQPER